ncbi:MAG: glycosyltransferase family 2 protein [Tsuneonella sp.]
MGSSARAFQTTEPDSRPSDRRRVSVVCIFFDGEDFLSEAIDSVLRQSLTDFELILVDDGSSDASGAIARKYADRDPARTRLLTHPGCVNRGMSASRNLGLARAAGEFVCFIDADDVWRPDKLRDQVELLDAHPEAGMVCGRVNYWSSWSGGLDRLVATGPRRGGTTTPPCTLLELYPLGTDHAPCPSDVMVRRELIDAVGRFEEEFTGMFEDQAFFAKVYLAAPVLFVGDVWLDYRQHPASSVAESFGSGTYAAHRRGFLDWLAGYVASREVDRRGEIEAAIARARRDLERPLAARIRRRLTGR